MDDETSKLILQALISDETSTVPQVDPVSMAEKMRYLADHMNDISEDDRRAVGNIIVINGLDNLLLECNEGTVLNLDYLATHYPVVLGQMYNLLTFKMARRV